MDNDARRDLSEDQLANLEEVIRESTRQGHDAASMAAAVRNFLRNPDEKADLARRAHEQREQRLELGRRPGAPEAAPDATQRAAGLRSPEAHPAASADREGTHRRPIPTEGDPSPVPALQEPATGSQPKQLGEATSRDAGRPRR